MELANIRDEPTVKCDTRVPQTLARMAAEKVPGVPMAVVIRIALARLVGLDSDQFLAPLSAGPKPRNRDIA
jgi:hypothetical protein